MSVKSDVTYEKKESSAFDLAVVLLEAIAIAVVIRIFLFQPFNIPSGSMIPTLLVGDYLFVSKYSYGYSKYSFPFGLNLFNGRILASDPQRGDVVVFKTPADNSTDYIKRLIGLPGDKVQLKYGRLYINGEPVKLERLPDKVEPVGPPHFRTEYQVPQYRETLPSGKSYTIQRISERCSVDLSRQCPAVDHGVSAADNTDVYTVPPGHYFMMGDNRDDSADSRFKRRSSSDAADSPFIEGSNGVGYVPAENLEGRARILFFSIDESASWFAPWRWPFEIRWSRIGNVIH